MKENRTEFIITRVTITEKEKVSKDSKKAKHKKMSDYVRKLLGLD